MRQRLKQLDLVGLGAMAEVYRGVIIGERGTSRQVAIKRLRPQLSHEAAAVELFVHEARVALQLNHPNVVHALELVRDELGYALVCEWLECASLASMVERTGRLPWPAAVSIGRALCSALAYLHGLRGVDGRTRGVIHRDVTPANVLVSRSGQVKLGDFGVAWSWAEAPQVRVSAAGTPGFAAPEQGQGGLIDARMDLYGVGATLRAIVAAPPPELGAVLDKACSATPAARFADAEALAGALNHVSACLGVPADDHVMRTWLAACGGVPVRAPFMLDGAVQSILGSALQFQEATPVIERRRRSPGRVAIVAGALVSVAVAAMVFASWGRSEPIDAAPPAPLAAEVPAPSPVRPDAGIARPATPPSEGKSDPVPMRVAPERKSGIVNLNAMPWASVTIDGKAVGDTPLKELKLPEGRHLLRLTHPPQQLERQVTIEVVADTAQTFVIDLRRGSVTVRRP